MPAEPRLSNRDWVARAIQLLDGDFHRSADTHLIPLTMD